MDECEVGTLRSLGEGGCASEGSALRSVWSGATAVRPWGSTFAPNSEAIATTPDASTSRAQRISGVHRAYVAGQAEDLARIPEVERVGGFDKRNTASFKDLLEGRIEGRVDPRQILAVGGNQIQGIQFASVGGAAYRLVKEKGLGREIPTDWLLQDVRN